MSLWTNNSGFDAIFKIQSTIASYLNWYQKTLNETGFYSRVK